MYIVSTRVALIAKNPYLRLFARIYRRTVACAYPFALILAFLDVIFLRALKNPLIITFITSLKKAFENNRVGSGTAYQFGFVTLTFYQTSMLIIPLFSGYFLFQKIKSNPILCCELVMADYISGQTYSLFSKRVIHGPNLQEDLKKMEYQDSLMNFFNVKWVKEISMFL